MRIQTNISAMNTNRQIGMNNSKIQKSLEKLSSGFAINRASDDAAGLAISEQMRAQINGLGVAEKNAQDAISLAQTAESGLAEIESIAQRMNELATKGANSTLDDQARTALTNEMTKLNEEIDRIAGGSNFNGINLLDGTFGRTLSVNTVPGALTGFEGVDASGLKNYSAGGALTFEMSAANVITAKYDNGDGTVVTQTITNATAPAAGETKELDFDKLGVKVTLNDGFTPGTAIASTAVTVTATNDTASFQVGSTNEAHQSLNFSIGEVSANTLGTDAIKLDTAANARTAMTTAQTAIDRVSTARSEIGAFQSRMEHASNNISATKENLSAAESRIRDTDMAAEMIEFTKNSVVAQAAQAMLAQANMQPQSVLQLLQ